MFEALATYPRIVVSGPHRAGTTICATMIAHDTGLRLVKEEDFGEGDEHRFREQLQIGGVLQAPFFAHLLHALPADVLIVFVMRSPIACLRSQARMRDRDGNPTGAGISEYRRRQYHTDGPDIAAVLNTWHEQRPLIRHWKEIQFESLAEHPLWEPERAHFHHRQTG